MVDFSTHLMLDDVNVPLLAKFADPAFAVAGYVNGGFANWATLVAEFQPRGQFLLSIDVRNDPAAGAQCLDVETGDAVLADAPGWFEATHAAGVKARDGRWFPKIYTSESNLPALVKVMAKAKIARSAYMIWSAHYTDVPHVCGPRSCGSEVQADATQWTDGFLGVSLDASECFGYFFQGAPAVPVAAPKPPARPPVVDHPVPEPVLSEGATGAHVKLLQELLNKRPIEPRLKVDGVFGPSTRAAVEAVRDRRPGNLGDFR
jgi:hypothetical protein